MRGFSTGDPILDIVIFIGGTLFVVWKLVGPGDSYYVTEREIQENRNISQGFEDLLEEPRPISNDAVFDGTVGPSLKRQFLHAPPDQLSAMRMFYLTTIEMTELGPPDGRMRADMFYANKGLTLISIGSGVAFTPTSDPVFTVSRLDDIANTLVAGGYEPEWDHSLSYVRRLHVTDPAGNQITLVGA